MPETILYATPPMRIGKHEWRMTVQPSRYGRGNVTEYQWRPADASARPEEYRVPWKGEEDWPRYNSHDGMYAGLPRTLKKLYGQHEAEIKAALKGTTPPADPQLPLPGLADHA